VIVKSAALRYNKLMTQTQKCNTNQTAKWIRVIVSLGVIATGIIYKNWIGLLGIFTLLSAFTGSCPLSLQFRSLRDIKIKRNNSD
jgi:uncharacterized protein (DUF58 family)